jgi:DedD protein
LVGGIVVVAAAIVFIPELLSGPKRASSPPEAASTSAAAEGTTRTYTIDLERESAASPLAPPTTGDVTTKAPPPEMPAESSPAPTPDPTPAGASAIEKNAAVELPASPPTRTAVESPRAATDAGESERSKPEPTKKAVRVSSGWAVQIGSFGTASSAEHVAQQFTQKGYNAYTQPVQVGAKTLYRVRLGPTPERSEAENLLKKIKLDQPNATLVSEP